MTDIKLDDLNVLAEEPLISPNKLKKQVVASLDALQTVAEGRKAIKRILNRQDPVQFTIPNQPSNMPAD